MTTTTEIRPSGDERRCGYRGCRKAMVRKDGEFDGVFRLREYCDRRCSNKESAERRRIDSGKAPVQTLADEPRHCGYRECGTLLVRGEDEKLNAFVLRKYCNCACAGSESALRRNDGDRSFITLHSASLAPFGHCFRNATAADIGTLQARFPWRSPHSGRLVDIPALTVPHRSREARRKRVA